MAQYTVKATRKFIAEEMIVVDAPNKELAIEEAVHEATWNNQDYPFANIEALPSENDEYEIFSVLRNDDDDLYDSICHALHDYEDGKNGDEMYEILSDMLFKMHERMYVKE